MFLALLNDFSFIFLYILLIYIFIVDSRLADGLVGRLVCSIHYHVVLCCVVVSSARTAYLVLRIIALYLIIIIFNLFLFINIIWLFDLIIARIWITLLIWLRVCVLLEERYNCWVFCYDRNTGGAFFYIYNKIIIMLVCLNFIFVFLKTKNILIFI